MKRHLEYSKKTSKFLRFTQIVVVAIAANAGTALADSDTYTPSRNGVIGGAAGFAVGAGATRYYVNRQDAKAATTNRSSMQTDKRRYTRPSSMQTDKRRYTRPSSMQTDKRRYTRGKQVRFNDKANRTYKIKKSGKSMPVNAKTPKSGHRRVGMTGKQARTLNKSKKAASAARTKRNSRQLISHKRYRHNQRKLAKRQGNGLRVKKGNVVLPKDARLGSVSHTKKGAKIGRKTHSARTAAKRSGMRSASRRHARSSTRGTGRKSAKSRGRNIRKSQRGVRRHKRGIKTAARTAKKGKRLRTIGKVATGGAVGMVAGAALGEQVPDVFDAAEYSVKLARDPRNAPKMLANTARGGVRMAGRMALTVTDPGKMARNLHGAARGVGRSIAKTGVYKRLAKTRTGRTIGKGTRWAGRTASRGYRKLARSRTGRAVGSVTRTIDRQVFKRTNKGLRKAGRTISRGSKSVARYAKRTSRKAGRTISRGSKSVARYAKKRTRKARKTVNRIGKGAKKATRKLKFW